MSAKDFLFELGTEELPPKALKALSTALESGIRSGLESLLGKEQLSGTTFKAYGAPRRLAVLATDLPTEVPENRITVQGPPEKIAFDADGNPSKALQGFARKCGTEVDQLSVVGGKYSFEKVTPAQPVAPLLAEVITQALDNLPIPKRMRWGSSRAEFVRPVKWVVLLFGDEVVPCEIMSHTAGRHTRGHRFHYNEPIELFDGRQYAETLKEKGKVLADFEERQELIRAQLLAEAEKVGGNVVIDEGLLEEVCALNEWPVALTGRFEARFLEVPSQALISSMADHQKYFHLLDNDGKLMPYFITVANIESRDPQLVIEGNEKVIRPRLSDAAFFFETDKKQTLESRTEALKKIVFQNELGTVFEKSTRISGLAGLIADQIGGDSAQASRAGLLCKADLVSEMVLEFPELQGLMGYHYALNDGEPEEVALAQNEHYMPRFHGDELPQTKTGIAVAIADRLDTLVGLFGINQPPTGSKDPFALRRATLGTLRIIVENDLALDLRTLLQAAADQYGQLPAQDSVVEQVLEFMLERFRAWYEERGISVDNYIAVHTLRPTKPLDFDRRVRAVSHFRTLPESASLAAANKRVSNILSKQEGEVADSVDSSLLTDAAEVELAKQVTALEAELAPVFEKGEYQNALEALAKLQAPVDRFFDEVMVMADDERVRGNRLALLTKLRNLFLGVADISLIAG
ncbi:glycine--tRNA ligase subunit beta [Marinobacterium mangrovicola]|uniref:Glycine--tRNA ligase beta subunit n=1 Tax=Marinobacterium mangrovicola TaxID=1476959 RepID=A0A4R1GHB7_9GAMM|nr:glycine--tRNA ligase subunit beta [Marinobacterium mangrovicola]TCK03602.1 glycyl-tRNA synthetase beta chain [Marinobacterium mangrovicola]